MKKLILFFMLLTAWSCTVEEVLPKFEQKVIKESLDGKQFLNNQVEGYSLRYVIPFKVSGQDKVTVTYQDVYVKGSLTGYLTDNGYGYLNVYKNGLLIASSERVDASDKSFDLRTNTVKISIKSGDELALQFDATGGNQRSISSIWMSELYIMNYDIYSK